MESLMSLTRTGREIVMERLMRVVRLSTTADLQRAAEFLEFAREVRGGCSKQRGMARRAQRRAREEEREERYWRGLRERL